MVLAFVVLALLAALLAYAAIKPATLRVQRSVGVAASPEAVFALVDDFRHWPSWSQQDRGDPRMARTYGERSRGKGATSEWTSEGSGGRGRMEIVESAAPSRVTIRVDFSKPFKAYNTNEFTFEPSGDQTLVTWAWQGTNVFVLKLMSVFIDTEKMMGKHFEAGLANLKALAERNAKTGDSTRPVA